MYSETVVEYFDYFPLLLFIKVTGGKYLSTLLGYTFEVLVLYMRFSIYCYFILLLHCSSADCI